MEKYGGDLLSFDYIPWKKSTNWVILWESLFHFCARTAHEFFYLQINYFFDRWLSWARG